MLLKYEQDHDTIILEASEYDSLKALCSEHTDLELGPKEMFSFLSYVFPGLLLICVLLHVQLMLTATG